VKKKLPSEFSTGVAEAFKNQIEDEHVIDGERSNQLRDRVENRNFVEVLKNGNKKAQMR